MKTCLRAGMNPHDIAKSGFARVDILSKEDLFPNEGYEFKPGKTKITNSYKMSEDSPFKSNVHHNIGVRSEEQEIMKKQIPTFIVNERKLTRAAAVAISTGKEGETRPIHSLIATQAVKKGMEQQLIMNEQTRIARMKDEAAWVEIEQKEAEATKNFLNRNDTSKKDQQVQLAAIYRKELELHKKRADMEKELEKQEAARITKIQAEEERVEREKARAKLEDEKKKLAEFERSNAILLDKKKLRLKEDLEIAERVEREHAEQETKQLAYDQIREKKREEKDRKREAIFKIQSKKLEEIKAKHSNILENSVSELEKLEELKRQTEIDKKKAMMKSRNDDMIEYLKKKEEMKKKQKKEMPALEIIDPDEEAREFEKVTRAEMMKSLRLSQQKQIMDRKAREKKELEDSLKFPLQLFFLKDEDQ